jgi:hypothetical protein
MKSFKIYFRNERNSVELISATLARSIKNKICQNYTYNFSFVFFDSGFFSIHIKEEERTINSKYIAEEMFFSSF